MHHVRKFIRLDLKGGWMGTEHVSSSTGGTTHEGISCYWLEDNDPVNGIENLWKYWTTYANAIFRPEDYNDMQITIFEGVKVGYGPDEEDLAKCHRTIAEFDAQPFMEAIQKLKEQFWDEEMTEEVIYNQSASISSMER